MKPLFNAILLVIFITAVADAAEIETRISTREAYVGSPIVLQVAISNSSSLEQPSLPTIDGCDIRSAGSPRTSSQITIINGRQSSQRSVTMQYLITPRREGTFTVPSMPFKADDETLKSDPMQFIATRSQTGDLMFVEIEGSKESVFVGEPLDLTLKIWIKPFHDPETGLTLGEGETWTTISASTSWGGFSDRMEELSGRGQRPGGEEVLREDSGGQQRSYYLYRIEATVYPKRVGRIDADDVQIVVNYPTQVGRARSPFSGFFDNSFFNGPFGSRLAITHSRPIVSEASVDATEVLPIPQQNRPNDYRGAVGTYRILTDASPTSVDAGDPISLRIAIVGTGPMELIQSPPLAEMKKLTKDFKVPAEPLAGYARDDTKFFSTTIRPRHADIDEIPPIGFSFFDPDTKQFETVFSEPIAISVDEAEMLALDSIVAGGGRTSPETEEATVAANLPDYTNQCGTAVLARRQSSAPANWWWAFVILPPIVFAGVAISKHRKTIGAWGRRILPAKKACLRAIDRARDENEIKHALAEFIQRRCRRRSDAPATGAQSRSQDPLVSAVGSLRLAGMYKVAADVETFLLPNHSMRTESLASVADTARELVDRVDVATASQPTRRIRRNKSPHRASPQPLNTPLNRGVGMFLFVVVFAGGAGRLMAAAPDDQVFQASHDIAASPAPQELHSSSLTLSEDQQATLLDEASDAYEQVTSDADAADAKESLTTAKNKYRLLVQSGIHNPGLYVNLANAEMQTGELGYAIANYENALRLDPEHQQARRNLAYADRQRQGATDPPTSEVTIGSLWERLIGLVSRQALIGILVLSSLTFWGLLTVRIVSQPFPVFAYAAVPLALLLLSLGMLVVSDSSPSRPYSAVIVADEVSLRAGDGDDYEPIAALSAAAGQRVETIAQRGQWTCIRTESGDQGWVLDRDLAILTTADE
ncbi:BatD family protein [Allorhodopirellula solitaria]|uniref:Uncharacterized protein n=1 Tax=Allorhodopirellula solitaria TaxID=2527987 RepID=A0A5C5YJU1_9BACT|nr:BatD family protein [Allorhodopirellula solitaria]TWT75079.1 hypothetical protein CA85_03670 [Allorhodopirellula solitaria]